MAMPGGGLWADPGLMQKGIQGGREETYKNRTGQEFLLFVTDPWGAVCGRQDTHENGASPSGACPQISAGQSSELQ